MADADDKHVPITIRGRCDICHNKDGFNGHNLQACKECHVRVHETCYGLVSTEGKDPDWLCHACGAVGTEVVVTSTSSKPGGDADGEEEKVEVAKQEVRPTACALCPVKTGPHAMHPLYDVGGRDGRHVVLPASKKGAPKQLAWVHTLCGMYHSAHSGMVYGCDKDGEWEDDEGETPHASASAPAQKADGDVSSESDSDDDGGKSKQKKLFTGTHHFVIGGKEKDTPKNIKWAKETRKNILEVRKLQCFVCNKKDNIHSVLRIPVQCSAGSVDENEMLKRRRLNPEISCDRAMHVGCAQWGENARGEKARFRRVFYHSGLQARDEEDFRSKPSVNCYCNKHAKEVHERKHAEKRRAQRRIMEDEEE